MGHIHTKPGQYDYTISAFIIRLDTPEPELVLHKHRLLGKYLQFGGHNELDENLWEAIGHEIREESGYKLSQLKILQPKKRVVYLSDALMHPVPVCINTHVIHEGHFHTDIEYAFTANKPPEQDVAEGESREIRSFTKSELASLSDAETYSNIREIGDFIFSVCLDEWESVNTNQFAFKIPK